MSDAGCASCPHAADPHVLVALETGDVMGVRDIPVSGVMLCPVCPCVTTWSVAGYPAPEMPDPGFLAVIRDCVFDPERRGGKNAGS